MSNASLSGPDIALPAGPRLTIALVFAGFVVAGLFLVMNVGVLGWGLLLAVITGCMLLGRPRAVMTAYWFWVVIYPYVSTLFPGALIKWSDEVLVCTMGAVLIMHYTQDRGLFRELKWFNRAFAALVALTVVSGIMNQLPRGLITHFALQYLRMFLLFYFAYAFLQPRHLKGVCLAIVLMVVLQFVLNFGWYLGINPLINWMSGPDLAIGTGIGANVCAYYSVFLLFLLFSYQLHSKGVARKFATFALILVTLVHLFLTFTYHAYLMLAICAVVYGGLHVRRYRARIPAAALLVFTVSAAALLPPSTFDLLRFELGPQRLKERVENLRYGPKGQSYEQNLTTLPQELPYPLLGAGPGNAGSMVARINFRPLANKYFMWVDLSVDRYRLSSGGSIIGGPATGLLALWSDLGPFGFLIYWSVHVGALWRVMSGVRQGRYTHRYKLILAEAFIPTMVMFLMLSFLADFSWMAYMNVLWIWAGAVWRYDTARGGAPLPSANPAFASPIRKIATFG